MALIKCSDCGKEFSDKASSCPSCGRPVVNEKSNITTQKSTAELNNKADIKVHNELEQSSMVVTIIGAIAGAITIISGITDDGIIFLNLASGVTLVGIGYISGLAFRWMASVLRQLNEIKSNMNKK